MLKSRKRFLLGSLTLLAGLVWGCLCMLPSHPRPARKTMRAGVAPDLESRSFNRHSQA